MTPSEFPARDSVGKVSALSCRNADGDETAYDSLQSVAAPSYLPSFRIPVDEQAVSNSFSKSIVLALR